MEAARTRPWWTPLLVVDYAYGLHLVIMLAYRSTIRPHEGAPLGMALIVVGVPMTAIAVLVGWLILAASWRRPGRRPAVDALIATGVGFLVAPVIAVILLALGAWISL